MAVYGRFIGVLVGSTTGWRGERGSASTASQRSRGGKATVLGMAKWWRARPRRERGGDGRGFKAPAFAAAQATAVARITSCVGTAASSNTRSQLALASRRSHALTIIGGRKEEEEQYAHKVFGVLATNAPAATAACMFAFYSLDLARHHNIGVGGGSYNHTAPLRARLSRHGRTLRASRARATRSARATCARAQRPSVLPATTPTTHDCVTYTCSSCHPHRPHQPEPPRARWTRRARAHGALQAAHTHTQRTHSAHRQA